ncbi:hypothetical protein BKA62DRAFT_151038 [Auriculariales sp. MPI-PUGE-AT-0066]|nr:hypothetical protein BKA62DRAFT_151038 [Auriculariales sp. MPI-PUGE-AT-0066]
MHFPSRSPSPTPYSSSNGLKCERLLRDTLRKADAAVARSRNPSLSRSRASTPAPTLPSTPTVAAYLPPHHSLIADCCSLSDGEEKDEPTSLRRTHSIGSHRFAPSLSSMTRSHTVHHRTHSPSPAGSAGSRKRASHSISHSPPLSLKHSSPLRPGPVSAARSDPTPTMFMSSSHEEALRNRLQGVLEANPLPSHATGAQKALRSVTGPNFSMAMHREMRGHSRSRSASTPADVEAAWWGSSTPASPTALSSRSASRSRHASSRESLSASASASVSGPSTPPSPSLGIAQLNLSHSPQLHLRHLTADSATSDMPLASSHSAASPQTPERPKFDLRTASQLCRTAPGLVSFRDVEGLGAPNHFYDADDDEENEHNKGWLATAFGWSPFNKKNAAKGIIAPGQPSAKSSLGLDMGTMSPSDATPTKAGSLTHSSV